MAKLKKIQLEDTSYDLGATTTSELENDSDFATNEAVDNVKTEVNNNIANAQGRNLIPYWYYDESLKSTCYFYKDGLTKTTNGITFTVNEDDGSITANGTATDLAQYYITVDLDNGMLEEGQSYTFKCLSRKGSSTSIRARILSNYTEHFADDEEINDNEYPEHNYYDYGDGVTFIANNDKSIRIIIEIVSGQTVSDLIFYPMLEIGTVAHVYEPTTESSALLKALLKNAGDSGWNDVIYGLSSIVSEDTNKLTEYFAPWDTNIPVRWRILNGVVYFEGVVRVVKEIPIVSGNNITTILKLPDGLKPRQSCYFMHHGSGQNIFMLTATSGGELRISNYGTTAERTKIPVDTWIPITCSYLAWS